MPKKLIYVMPRIRVAPRLYGKTELAIGKAIFLPDDDSTWTNRIQKPRPSCLDTFRQFPYRNNASDLPVSRGTILISDDESWLRENVSYVVAVAYVLGVQENFWQPPAEAFQYYDIAVGDTPQDLVQFHTKTSSLIEDTSAFKLLPPLELRGPRDQFLVDPRSDVFAELSKRLGKAEPDRLIVSCFHLFRTQYANAFLAPARQDFAAYCACLEAAFDTPKSQDGGKTLAECIQKFYMGYEGLGNFIRGLYEERSIFNHGVSEAALESHRTALLKAFRQTPYRWDLLRHICMDVVHEKAREAAGNPRGDIGTFFSKSFKMVETSFSSKHVWESLCGELTKKGSVKALLKLQQSGTDTEQDDAKLSEFIGLCCRFLLIHEWSKKDAKTEANKACASLQCLAEIIHATSTNADVKEAAEQLHAAAKARDQKQLGDWAAKHASWTMLRGYENLCEAGQAVSAHVAQLFDFC